MNSSITAQILRRAADLKERIEALEAQLSALISGGAKSNPRRKGGMSAAGRARIAAAQRARWAKANARSNGAATQMPRREMSAAAKARLAAIARARWKKAKAAGKATL